MNCTIKLVDGSLFIAERPWYYGWFDWPKFRTFKKAQGKDCPLMDKKDRLQIPSTSILYVVEKRG